ncbi:MAG: ribonuclease [Acidobacteria bacterium]|nr:ribonuclease [Acidobacteriota bacterium]
MILIDTSVWIDHFHSANPRLVAVLENLDVLCHPFVIGELACGQLKTRRETLDLLSDLQASVVATDDEALQLIEHRGLMGKGLGYADVHLLASVMLTEGASLWTRDKRLAAVAADLHVAFQTV